MAAGCDLLGAGKAEVAGKGGVAVEEAAIDGGVRYSQLLAEKAGAVPGQNCVNGGFVSVLF